jgi:hypothetical protein
MKIGITYDPANKVNEIFANGIKQNSIFLCETLQNCDFDVSLIVAPGKWELNDVSKFSNQILKVDQYENIDNYDLIFQVTYQMKILTTAIFSVILLRKSLSIRKW